MGPHRMGPYTMGPLQGVRVLDLSRFLPGPFCTMQLTLLGAEVIKVENPILGDPGRLVPPLVDGQSIPFRALNSDKRSIAVNYRSADGREVVAELVKRADVLIESFKPGYLQRIGLGYAACRAWNERLVFCSLAGYAARGSAADRSGHDLNFLARSGLLDALRGTQPWPFVPGLPLADLLGGVNASVAILAALVAARSSGVGSHLQLSMVGGATQLLATALAEAGLSDSGPQDLGRPTGPAFLSGEYPSYALYATADSRHMSLGIIEPNIWAEFCKLLGRPDLASGQFPATAEGRAARRAELATIFASKTQREWIAYFDGADVCCEPVLSVAEAGEDLASEAGREEAGGAAHDDAAAAADDAAWAFPPAAFMEHLGVDGERVPALGEHTLEILGWLGIEEERIADLRRRKIVATPADVQPPRHTNIF